MIKRIQTILQTECRLTKDRLVLVGVSGGPDSLCLVELLHRSGYPLLIAHLNHGLRPEAVEEARQVEDFARSLGHPFILGEAAVKSYAQSQTLSLEEAARVVRYRFLFEQAERSKAQAVAVGHTASDQVETVLMHLLRGAGLSGLKGMVYRSLPTAWSREIPLVRPLLGFWREEVLAYVQERGLKPAFDATNLDTRYYRNRLRHELLPYLEGFNPHIRQILWRTAQVLAAEDAVLEAQVQTAWEKVLVEGRPGSRSSAGGRGVVLSRSRFLSEPLGIQRRLLRRGMERLRENLRDVDFQTIERGLAVLSAGTTRGRCDLVAGLKLVVEGDRVWINDSEAGLPGEDLPQVPPDQDLYLEIPGSAGLIGGWKVTAELVDDARRAHEMARDNEDLFQAWVDASTLRLPLVVRGRLPGDRFQPLGLDGHSMKLSDFMINEKIPQQARDGWPLVLSGAEIIWVPGYRLAHPARLTSNSRRAVHLRMENGDYVRRFKKQG